MRISKQFTGIKLPDYYQELLQKGRAYLEIIELQIRLPDLNGDVTNIIEGDLLPVRYAPKFTHMSRYLSFNSSTNELNSIHQIQDRNAILFNKIMGFLINDIHMHITLLPKYIRVKVICALNDNFKPLMENIWQERLDNIYPGRILSLVETYLNPSINCWIALLMNI